VEEGGFLSAEIHLLGEGQIRPILCYSPGRFKREVHSQRGRKNIVVMLFSIWHYKNLSGL